METINDRIGIILEESGKTKTEFARTLKVSQQYISKLVKTGNPSDILIEDICQKYGYNEEWLRNGTPPIKKDIDVDFGEICREIGQNDPKFKEAITKYYELSPEDKQLFWKFMERFSKPEKEG